MPNFKYTVANKSGKKLSGTVEAPDEKIAREELKNLGFSILSLQVTSEATKLASHLTKFVFEGYDKNSKLVSGTIPAKTKEDALKRLKEQYELNINAIWQEGATKEAIQEEKNANLIQKEVLHNTTTNKEDTSELLRGISLDSCGKRRAPATATAPVVFGPSSILQSD